MSCITCFSQKMQGRLLYHPNIGILGPYSPTILESILSPRFCIFECNTTSEIVLHSNTAKYRKIWKTRPEWLVNRDPGLKPHSEKLIICTRPCSLRAQIWIPIFPTHMVVLKRFNWTLYCRCKIENLTRVYMYYHLCQKS